MNYRVKDLTGQRFNRWTVVMFAGTNKLRQAMWACKCDCGTVKNVRAAIWQTGNHSRVIADKPKSWRGFLQRTGSTEAARTCHGAR